MAEEPTDPPVLRSAIGLVEVLDLGIDLSVDHVAMVTIAKSVEQPIGAFSVIVSDLDLGDAESLRQPHHRRDPASGNVVGEHSQGISEIADPAELQDRQDIGALPVIFYHLPQSADDLRPAAAVF